MGEGGPLSNLTSLCPLKTLANKKNSPSSYPILNVSYCYESKFRWSIKFKTFIDINVGFFQYFIIIMQKISLITTIVLNFDDYQKNRIWEKYNNNYVLVYRVFEWMENCNVLYTIQREKCVIYCYTIFIDSGRIQKHMWALIFSRKKYCPCCT